MKVQIKQFDAQTSFTTLIGKWYAYQMVNGKPLYLWDDGTWNNSATADQEKFRAYFDTKKEVETLLKTKKPSLKIIAKKFVTLWRSGAEAKCQFVLDQLGGYDNEKNLQVQYAEVAATTALMLSDPRMTPKNRRELTEELYETTKLL